MRIGGMSYKDGIKITSETVEVKVSRNEKNDFHYDVVAKNRYTKFEKSVRKIPLIRGFSFFSKFSAIKALLILSVTADVNKLIGINPGFELIIMLILRLFIVYFIITNVIRAFTDKEMLKYHSAEHMAINTFDSNLELNAENIKRASPLSYICGTMLFFYISLIAVPCVIFIPYSSAVCLVVFCLSYELFLWAWKVPATKWLASWGLWLQRHRHLLPPEQRHIELACLCINKLVEVSEQSDGPRSNGTASM